MRWCKARPSPCSSPKTRRVQRKRLRQVDEAQHAPTGTAGECAWARQTYSSRPSGRKPLQKRSKQANAQGKRPTRRRFGPTPTLPFVVASQTQRPRSRSPAPALRHAAVRPFPNERENDRRGEWNANAPENRRWLAAHAPPADALPNRPSLARRLVPQDRSALAENAPPIWRRCSPRGFSPYCATARAFLG